MATMAVIGGVVGLLLGLRLRAFVLVPASLAAAAVAAIALFRDADPWFIAGSVAVVTASVELGYLIGPISLGAMSSAHAKSRVEPRQFTEATRAADKLKRWSAARLRGRQTAA